MRFAFDLFSLWVVISIYIESSLQFDCLPNGDAIPGVHRDRPNIPELNTAEMTPSRANPHSLGRTFPFARRVSMDTTHSHSFAHSSSGVPPFAGTSLRTRSRSSTTRPSRFNILHYASEELPFIRLISRKNLNRKFQIQRYVFPSDKPVQFRRYNNCHKPIPTEQQIVLSTSNGDVFGILEEVNSETRIRGLFTLVRTPSGVKDIRAKINMYTVTVFELTKDEIIEIPVGNQGIIAKNYIIERV